MTTGWQHGSGLSTDPHIAVGDKGGGRGPGWSGHRGRGATRGTPHGQREHTVQHLRGGQVGNDFKNYLQMSITFPLGFYSYDFLLQIQSASVHGAPKPGVVLGAGIRTVHQADKKGSVFSKLAFS